MFRFTIRELVLLTLVAGLVTAWSVHAWQQGGRIQRLESIVRVETRDIFPQGWEGLTAAMRNEKAILKYRVQALTYELEKRRHRVEIGETSVSVQP